MKAVRHVASGVLMTLSLGLMAILAAPAASAAVVAHPAGMPGSGVPVGDLGDMVSQLVGMAGNLVAMAGYIVSNVLGGISM